MLRVVEAVNSYVMYRESCVQSRAKAFKLKMALKQDHEQYITDLLSTGRVGNDSLSIKPNDEQLHSAIDDGIALTETLDAHALGLVEEFNALVYELHRLVRKHRFSYPKNELMPEPVQLISIGGGSK